jgi:hypothetical protein
MTLDILRQKFIALGFRADSASYSEQGMFYKPIQTKRPCIMNGRDQLCVDYYRFEGDRPYSFTVEIRGQVPVVDRWARLQIYGIGADELFEHLPAFEAALIRAWEALAP